MISVAELDERIERCLTILGDNPHSQVFAALAEAYRRRGEFGRAFSVCKRGLKYHPDYALAHIVMAKLYLHQKMTDEALSSLKRAVEIDGPTRATDLLEAELHLTTGDAAAAQVVIARLRRAQPNNPLVEDLAQQLRQLRASAASTEGMPHASSEQAETPHETVAPRPTAELANNWTEWAAAMGLMRGVTGAIVFDAPGHTLASNAQAETSHANMETLSALFRDAEAHLRKAGWGALTEIRIEVNNRELWTGRVSDFMLGLTGNLQGTFGEVRRRALESASRVITANSDSAADEPCAPPEIGTDETENTRQTAAADGTPRAEEGNEYGV